MNRELVAGLGPYKHSIEMLTGECMSLMRGIVENTIRNMSPVERHDALLSVVGEVVRTMMPEERTTTLVEIVRLLSDGIDADQRAAAALEAAGY